MTTAIRCVIFCSTPTRWRCRASCRRPPSSTGGACPEPSGRREPRERGKTRGIGLQRAENTGILCAVGHVPAVVQHDDQILPDSLKAVQQPVFAEQKRFVHGVAGGKRRRTLLPGIHMVALRIPGAEIAPGVLRHFRDQIHELSSSAKPLFDVGRRVRRLFEYSRFKIPMQERTSRRLRQKTEPGSGILFCRIKREKRKMTQIVSKSAS